MSKHRYVKTYPKKFREQVVKLVPVTDRTVRQVAEEFGIAVDSVLRWVQQAEHDLGSWNDGLPSEEREILSRAAAWFARETDSIP